MTYMNSEMGKVLIRFTGSAAADPSLSGRSFYTFMAWKKFAPGQPHIVSRIIRIYETNGVCFDEPFTKGSPQKPSQAGNPNLDSCVMGIIPGSAGMARPSEWARLLKGVAPYDGPRFMRG